MMQDGSCEFDVVAVGRAYTDLIARVPHAFLDRHGIPIGEGPRLDVPSFQKIKAELGKTIMAAGGVAGNAMADVASLGGKAGFFGKVHRDELGTCFLEDFEKRGVVSCCEPYDDKVGLSACCLVLLTDDGERSFVLTAGCADQVRESDFTPFDFARTAFLFIEAEVLTISSAKALILEQARRAKASTKLVINAHNIPSWEEHAELASFVASQADIIIGNETEMERLTRVAPVNTHDAQIVVTTRGEKGASARQGDNSYFVPATKPVNFVSSVGAGDAFAAAFLLLLARGKKIEEGLARGTRAAAFVIEEETARPNRSMRGLFL